MRFTPDNFLYALKQIVTGGGKLSNSTLQAPDGGFNRDEQLDVTDAVLGTGTTAGLVSNMVALTTAASSTTVGTWQYQIPRDYDQTTDKLIVRVIADSAGTTDTPKLTVTPHTLVLGGTPVAITGITSSTGVSNVPQVFEFDFSGNGLVRDELFALTLTTAAHTTDAVQTYSIEIVYASTLVAFLDETLGNDPSDLAALDAVGNPLR